MKNLILILFLGLSTGLFSQTYTENLINNESTEYMDITFYKGDSIIVLNDNTGPVIKTYLLENMTTSTFIAPTVIPGWSYIILHKQHKTTYHNVIGPNYKVVLDNNYYSWLRIH